MPNNMRVKQAAHYLGLSKSTLDKLRCFGGGPRYFKLGRAVVYEASDLETWKAQRARASTWGANDNGRSQAAA